MWHQQRRRQIKPSGGIGIWRRHQAAVSKIKRRILRKWRHLARQQLLASQWQNVKASMAAGVIKRSGWQLAASMASILLAGHHGGIIAAAEENKQASARGGIARNIKGVIRRMKSGYQHHAAAAASGWRQLKRSGMACKAAYSGNTRLAKRR